jgi:hypothetical protein
MPSVAITKAEFTRRARERFVDPAFEGLQDEIGRIIDATWDGYHGYPMWVAAHGVMIVTPVNWYQAPSGLKAMMESRCRQILPGRGPQRRKLSRAGGAPGAKRQARSIRCPPSRDPSEVRNRCRP